MTSAGQTDGVVAAITVSSNHFGLIVDLAWQQNSSQIHDRLKVAQEKTAELDEALFARPERLRQLRESYEKQLSALRFPKPNKP